MIRSTTSGHRPAQARTGARVRDALAARGARLVVNTAALANEPLRGQVVQAIRQAGGHPSRTTRRKIHGRRADVQAPTPGAGRLVNNAGVDQADVPQGEVSFRQISTSISNCCCT